MSVLSYLSKRRLAADLRLRALHYCSQKIWWWVLVLACSDFCYYYTLYSLPAFSLAKTPLLILRIHVILWTSKCGRQNSPKLVLVTFLVTCETIERKNIPFSQRVRPDGSRLLRTRGNLLERAWTTSRMRKVGSSRPWLFHIFQRRALIFPLLVGEFFSHFWWYIYQILKNSVGGKKIRQAIVEK